MREKLSTSATLVAHRLISIDSLRKAADEADERLASAMVLRRVCQAVTGWAIPKLKNTHKMRQPNTSTDRL